jgi:hypothetical protein
MCQGLCRAAPGDSAVAATVGRCTTRRLSAGPGSRKRTTTESGLQYGVRRTVSRMNHSAVVTHPSAPRSGASVVALMRNSPMRRSTRTSRVDRSKQNARISKATTSGSSTFVGVLTATGTSGSRRCATGSVPRSQPMTNAVLASAMQAGNRVGTCSYTYGNARMSRRVEPIASERIAVEGNRWSDDAAEHDRVHRKECEAAAIV